jgi:hypothetical protein
MKEELKNKAGDFATLKQEEEKGLDQVDRDRK